jgi:hypothetical protein
MVGLTLRDLAFLAMLQPRGGVYAYDGPFWDTFVEYSSGTTSVQVLMGGTGWTLEHDWITFDQVSVGYEAFDAFEDYNLGTITPGSAANGLRFGGPWVFAGTAGGEGASIPPLALAGTLTCPYDSFECYNVGTVNSAAFGGGAVSLSQGTLWTDIGVITSAR